MKKFTFAALAVPLMWVLLLLLFFSSNKLHAQETMVLSGVVKSADGSLLEGVTVWQKDTDNGTQTNSLGSYSLEVSSDSSVVFEYIGFKTQTIRVSGKVLNVTLVADADTLEELVINAGYYSVKDKERTGSISKITSKEIGQQPVANPLAAMQGRMAGVNITQSSGTPGGGFDIQIRGRNSLRTEGNAPLYIVDGVPYASQSASDPDLSRYTFSEGNVSPLNSISPNDIESIEVLKDADATAIYGSRGSNGVVLITTKRGSADKTTFSLHSTTSVSSVATFMDMMTTEQYLQMRRDAFSNDGIAQYPANAHDINGNWDMERSADWQKEFLDGKAVSQNTQFSVGGGSGQTTYNFSASHRKDQMVSPGDFGYNRTNFLLSVNHASKNKRFSMQSNIQKNSQKNNQFSGDLTGNVFLAPNSPVLYDADGNLNWENNTFENPLAKLNSRYFSTTSDIIAQVQFEYELFSNLKLSLQTGTTRSDVEEYRTLPHTIMNPMYNYTPAQSSVTSTRFGRNSWIAEPKISWFRKGDAGRWDVLLGSTLEERNQDVFSVNGNGFLSNSLIMNVANAQVQKVTIDSETKYRYAALFGRLNYIHREKYIVNVTGRRDGSSRFGTNNRFANFGAVGAAWLFSREKAFNNSSWLSFGKLRGSYGIAGSDLIGDYQYLNMFGISQNNYNNQTTLEALRLYNPDFSWENNKKLEAAVELEFFNGRIAPSVSWYRNRSSNQLVGIPLPGTTGFASVQANLDATVENTGWEFTLRTVNIDKKDFKWSMNLNVTVPRNKLISFPNLEESTYANRYVVGQPITIRKVYNYIGIDKETGLYEVEDVNNDGIINNEDRTTVVNVGTRSFGGLHNSFRYRNWSLDFLWQFVKQNAYTPDYYSPLPGSMNNNRTDVMDYFSADNPNAAYQRPSTGTNAAATVAFNNFKNSNAVVDDASYIRLKSLQLQYTLPTMFFKGSTSLNVFIQGFNLLTFTAFKGLDPETQGMFLPSLRTVSAGFNLNF